MPNKKISGLYAIVDSQFNPCPTYAELAEKYLLGGCSLIQLRIKFAAKSDLLSAAHAIMKLKGKYDFRFIINDNAEVAMEIGADGVHVGENDTPVDKIKDKYGDKFIVGYSSHSIEEALNAAVSGADYVAFGAIFPTKTKGLGHPVQGIDRLRELVSCVNMPVVAIGGINRGNIDSVISTGVSSVAMITALSQARDVVNETRWFVGKMQEK